MRMIDRYILRQIAPSLGVSLAVVLVALVLERILRLFNIIADQGAQFGSILSMTANLLPHYLGLALPAAFFTSIFLLSARFSENNELDALRNCGLSIRRFSRPLICLGLVLCLFGIALYGYVQPYSRYAYRAIFHAVIHAPWDASVTAGTFIDAGQGYTLYADGLDDDGQSLTNVFIHERRNTDGADITTTAHRGKMRLSDDGQWIAIDLWNAVQIRREPGKSVTVLSFDHWDSLRPYTPRAKPYRPRGQSERELTLNELIHALGNPASPISHDSLQAEFHGRLVRALSLAILPMLAVPMGMSAKRAYRWQGIAVAALILLLYYHAIQLGESLGSLGRVDPRLGLWGPFLIFSAGCSALFFTTERRAGSLPFDFLFERVDGFLQSLKLLIGRLLPKNEERGMR